MIAVVLAIVVNAGVDATGFDYGWIVSAPSVGGFFVILLRVFDTAAWRWHWVRRVGVTSTPIVEGIYEGTLRSTYQGVEMPVRLKVEQRWLRIIIRFQVLDPQTSESRSAAAAVTDEGHHDARLIYTYSNQIRHGIADDDMNDHDGAADVVLTPDGHIRGRYFNARGRQGVLELTRVGS
ncbi:hypothetical protein ABIB26_000883 [Arthrobacter sp. UYEF20]